MSNDTLLIGWTQIYNDLFVDDIGKRMISIHTLKQKHGPNLKACGAVFAYRRGKARTPSIAGWKSVIQNYFILLGQKEDAARIKKKLLKSSIKTPNIEQKGSKI